LDLYIGGLSSKSEARIAKQIRMNKDESPKRFDLEERTFAFAKRVREFGKRLSKTIGNTEDSRQLIRSSGSVGANYIEANESLSKKDFVLRIKILLERSKGDPLLAATNRSDRRKDRHGTRPTCAGGAGVNEHLRRDRAEERMIRFDHSIFSDCFELRTS
jgi:23S rRNA-intervening sequence protein